MLTVTKKGVFMPDNKFDKKYVLLDPSQQRRKFPRVRLETPCDIYYRNLKKPVTGILVDIGLGGIRFETHSLFYEGDLMDIEFFWDGTLFRIPGIVIRMNGKYCAVKTEKTPEDVKIELQKLIIHYYQKESELKTSYIVN